MGGKLPTQTYNDISENKLDYEYLRNKLKLKHIEAKQNFANKYPHVDRYLKNQKLELDKVREHSAKIVGTGAITGALLLTSPSNVKALPTPSEILEKFKFQGDDKNLEKLQKLLVDNLELVLPKYSRPLSRNEEKLLEQLFENIIGVKARATLEGEHLNTTYGLIGAEQHLPRFPGDKVSLHDPETQKSGITPGKGAWGYFAPSQDKLTTDLEEKEKWYAVVQTLYLPDWASRQPYLKEWYKYRKVLIVNTQNGNAVVAAIADSGPAMFTGKNFGGSPEVMDYLGGERYKKGPVVLFFVDDPENKVQLGPVDYNKSNYLASVLKEI